jgi:hypothetical protein
MNKTDKCSLYPKHKWEFVENKVFTKIYSSNSADLTSKAIYKCACGAKKTGAHRNDH